MTQQQCAKTLTKADLVNYIAVRLPPKTEKQLKTIVDGLIKSLSDALHESKTIYLGPAVGKLHVKVKAPRPAANYGPIPACVAVTLTKKAASDPNNKYLRSDFIADLQKNSCLTRREARDVARVWETFLSYVQEQNLRIEFRGFGSFYPRSFGAITRRNPQTNVTFTAEPKTVTAFKASRLLRKSLEAALLV